MPKPPCSKPDITVLCPNFFSSRGADQGSRQNRKEVHNNGVSRWTDGEQNGCD